MIGRLLNKIKNTLYGDLTTKEFEQFGMLSFTFLFIIGSYWLLRPLKDGVFAKVVGAGYLPYAKMCSFAIILPLVLIYAKLVDLVEKQKLFYIIAGGYACLFATVAVLLNHPTIGLANITPSKYRLLGWVFYVSIETFGSLLIALFWSFVASNTPTESAKKGYGLIIFGAQIGSMLGPTLAIHAEEIGISVLTWIVTGCLLLIPVLIKIYITWFPNAAEKSVSKKKKTSPVEGLRLIATKPYLMGVLGISTLYEIVATILDLQMKFLANEAFTSPEALTSFFGKFGLATNFVTFAFALLGTSLFIRRFGLIFCLVLFPTIAGIIVVYAWAYPMLWVLFGCMVAYKATSYALNNPCKEIMYIPTSKDVKFKAKSCIDMFGGRTAKATGSGVKALVTNTVSPILYGSLISLGVIAVWISAALYVGRTNKKLVDEGNIIE